jgi:hypothetical protein
MIRLQDRDKITLENEYTDKIIDLVNHADDMTTSDMQGVAQAIIMNLMRDITSKLLIV